MTKAELNQKLAGEVLRLADKYLDEVQRETLELLAKGKQSYCENWQPHLRLNGGRVEIFVGDDLGHLGRLEPVKANFAASGPRDAEWCLDFVELVDTVRLIVSCWQAWVDEYNAGVKP